jgi:hypothetical protein
MTSTCCEMYQKRERIPLLDVLLDCVRLLDCSGSRDKVFASLNVQDSEGSLDLKADYHAPASRVYTAAARSIIQKNRNLHLLAGVSGRQSERPDLPSWIPNWDEPFTSRNQQMEQCDTLRCIKELPIPSHTQCLNAIACTCPRENPRHCRWNDEHPFESFSHTVITD